MNAEELKINYLYWCTGKRDVFNDFKFFSRTVKYEKIEMEGSVITYELVEFKDEDTILYAVVNDYVTLYVTQSINCAIQALAEFASTIKKFMKEEH
ncbi:hypothetical protein MGH68_18720 [Erysipelothrix sp. D19-032]|uniref:hypothetical protein n=1 Tax=Erysipelothrix TaxID=1647 RepID=UPI00135A543A|nr:MULTISPECIES: hypothetical protein [Erysipelothrix]